MFGLNPQGFKRKQYTDIKNDMQDRAKSLFGDDVNLSEKSPLGLLIKLFSWSLGIVWQLAEKVYFNDFVSTSEGVSLDRLSKRIGLSRNRARQSEGEVTFVGDEDTIIEEGFRVSTPDGIEFETIEEVTIPVSGEVNVEIISLLLGENTNVAAGRITEIVNPIAGLDSVTNAVATAGGADVETDAEFRLRYERSINRIGSSTSASIESTILSVDGVTDARVRENDNITVVGGLPAKSIAPIVAGGTDSDVALAILETKAGGIESFGDTTITIEDSRGVEFSIGFTRPAQILIDISITLTTDANYPGDGNEQIEDAITEYINSLGIGQDVIYTKLVSFCHVVNGVLDVNLTVNATTANITIDEAELAVLNEVIFV